MLARSRPLVLTPPAAARGPSARVARVLFAAALAFACSRELPDARAQAHAIDMTPATVTYLNRPIVTLRGALLGVGPGERARGARARIDELLDRGDEGKVAVEDVPQGAAVLIDSQMAFVIVHEDAHAVPGATARTLADQATARLERVIAETREARDARFLGRAAVHAAVATMIWLVAIALAIALWRWSARRLMRAADEHAAKLALGGAAVVSRDGLIRFARRFVAALGAATLLLLTWQWLGYVLGLFPYTRPWSEGLTGFFLSTALGILVAVAHALPELFVAIAIFVIAWFVDRLQRGFFDQLAHGRVTLGAIDRDSAPATRRLVTIAIWLFAAAMAYPYIPGSETEAFKGLSVLIGLMVSVGASGIVGQAAAGLILMYTRTFRPGDFIRVADREGTVVRMGMFTTAVRTGLGEELALPNAFVLGNVVTNYSRAAIGTGFVLDTTVTIGYDAPWRQVHALLVEAATKTRGVLAEPKPRVFQVALSDFYVEYRVVCQGAAREAAGRAEMTSALHESILDAFNAAGVQIMSPHYMTDPAKPKIAPPG